MIFCVLWLGLLVAEPAQAANCFTATSQGTTGPVDYNSYCWIDFSTFSQSSAGSVGGQNFKLSLNDGTSISFKLEVSGVQVAAVASPSWNGAAVGNTAFVGIAGKPILYSTGGGTTIVRISNIVLVPASTSTSATSYMFVVGDGESTNCKESLTLTTDGGSWALLDAAGAVDGTTFFPSTTGLGTTSIKDSGTTCGRTGSHVFGTSAATSITATFVGSGRQGIMIAVRYASISLETRIAGARVSADDQFAFAITDTNDGSVLAGSSTFGAGLGPFAVHLDASAGAPVTLNLNVASGSANDTSHYASSLDCFNANLSSTTQLPNNVSTTSLRFGTMQFGDIIRCTYTVTPYPHLLLQMTLAFSEREISSDQIALKLIQNSSTVAANATISKIDATVIHGSTTMTQVSPGATYTFVFEDNSGSIDLAQYDEALSCTNANSNSSSVLPKSVDSSFTPQMGDVVTCTITNTNIPISTYLKTQINYSVISDPLNGTENPKFVPGAIIFYIIKVINNGSTSIDRDSISLILPIPRQISIGTASSVSFSQGSPASGLNFDAATDIKYSDGFYAPASFADCTYIPISAYDPFVRYVCLNPKGVMQGCKVLHQTLPSDSKLD